MNSNESIDEIYNNSIEKIKNINKKYPKLSHLWSCYFEKNTQLYKQVLKDLNYFIDNVSNIPNDLNENDILMLYLISNNNININN